MYYRGGSKVPEERSDSETVCYAESPDGIRWTKPSLGRHEFGGNRANNILLQPDPKQRFAHNFVPFIDDRPGVPAAERYKAVGGHRDFGLIRFVSADGLDWRKFSPEPLFKGYALDALNVPLWVPADQCYAIYLRTFTGDGYPTPAGVTRKPDAVRTISRSVSKDFVTWSRPEPMTFGDTPLEHLYANNTRPYFRAPHILIALGWRFFPERKIVSDEELIAFGVHEKQRLGVHEPVLMSSRGGNVYDRTFMEAFIRPGLDRKAWHARNTRPSVGLVPTGPNEMSFYATTHHSLPSNHLQRYSLRLDGLASARAGYAEGRLDTKVISMFGDRLIINYSTSAAGHIRVALVDDRGEPIPGFRANECDTIIGDQVARVVSWSGRSNLQPLAGRPLRVRFMMKDADLYSFTFARAP